jgi:PLP dependent protein
VNNIATNLARLHDRIDAAADAAGRAPKDIRLIAVSKGHSIEAIGLAAAAGQRAFGENTMQESLEKIPHFRQREIEWHFIGHLQSNKAKFLPNNFAWLHTLDSFNLAQRLSRPISRTDEVINALIEVNVSGDKNKYGISPDDVHPLLEELLRHQLPSIVLRGLMTIAPYPADEHAIRSAFARLRTLRDDCAKRFALSDFTELSMGMSGDYVDAIKEGATMIRIGTAIFGERNYTKR